MGNSCSFHGNNGIAEGRECKNESRVQKTKTEEGRTDALFDVELPRDSSEMKKRLRDHASAMADIYSAEMNYGISSGS